MNDYINRASLINNLNTFALEHYDSLVNDLILKEPAADVCPVGDVEEAIDETLRILNAINSSGRMDYEDYCNLHDAICTISPTCGADMKEEN